LRFLKTNPVISTDSLSAKQTQQHMDSFVTRRTRRAFAWLATSTGWQPSAHPMQRMPDGCRLVSLEFHHGHPQYLFLVDGKPTLDPNARGGARNERGEPVSLIAVS